MIGRVVLSVALLWASVLAGCATAPPSYVEQDYGKPTSQEDAQAMAEAFFKKTLKDPYSVVFEWQPIYKGYLQSAAIFGGRSAPGYVLRGTMNAKNSYGAYVGARAVVVVFNYGAIMKAEIESEGGIMMPAL